MSGSNTNRLFEPLQIADPSSSPNQLTQGTPSQGAALGDLYTAALAERQRQMQISRDRGLWSGGEVWEGGHPTAKGALDIGQQWAGAFEGGVKAYHGSPHSFEKFDASKIGTGEGAQAYGHGLYFAEKEGTAQSYRDELAARKNQRPATIKTGGPFGDVEILERDPTNPGSMYEVNIGAEPEQFLHYDKPVSEQSPQVQAALQKAGYALSDWGGRTGGELLKATGDPANAAQFLQGAGIPGIRYLDQGSRGAGEGSHNYVVFDANTIDILRKYGIAGLMAGGAGAAAATSGSQEPTQ